MKLVPRSLQRSDVLVPQLLELTQAPRRLAVRLDGADAVEAALEVVQAVLDEREYLPEPACFRCPLSLEPATCGLACADEIETVLERRQGQVAAVIVEPVSGNMGCVPPQPLFLHLTCCPYSK